MTPTMFHTPFVRRMALPVAAGLAILLVMIDAAAAQPRRLRAQAAAQARAENPGADPAELARLFDAYTVMQAQEVLGLDDARFGPFVTRLRALQELRRRHLRERAVVMRDMRRLLQTSGNDPLVKEKLDDLARLDATTRADEQKARDAVDEILDVRQRARFRLLEQQLELRKLELVNRARARLRPARP
jgi:hypothetical protein